MKKKAFTGIPAVLIMVLMTWSACSNEPGFSFTGADYITISTISMPDSIKLGESGTITMKAKAPDGCFYLLQYDVKKVDDKNTIYLAWGKFNDGGNCSSIKPEVDTTITFTPSAVGKYFYSFNAIPNPVKRDSIIVWQP